MKKTKDDSSLCIHCNIEMFDIEIIDGKCSKCGNEDFEEVWTDEWASLSDEERQDILQDEEDNDWYNSVRRLIFNPTNKPHMKVEKKIKLTDWLLPEKVNKKSKQNKKNNKKLVIYSTREDIL